jgi:hypothetical protein
LALLLCGCATDGKLAGTPPKAVDLSALDVCRNVLGPIDLPPVTANTDARAAFAADDARLIAAIAEIATARGCIADVKTAYAKGK